MPTKVPRAQPIQDATGILYKEHSFCIRRTDAKLQTRAASPSYDSNETATSLGEFIKRGTFRQVDEGQSPKSVQNKYWLKIRGLSVIARAIGGFIAQVID